MVPFHRPQRNRAPSRRLGCYAVLAAADAPCGTISQQTGFPIVNYWPDEEVLQFFDGFDLVKPGLVDISEWHPEQDSPQVKIELVGAVGRKAG